MSLLQPAKKSLIAVALVAPLALAARGSGDEENKAPASSTVKTTVKATKTETTTSAAPTTSSEEAPAEPNPEGEDNPEAAPQTLANPFENGVNPLENAQPVAPVQGQPAGQADVDGINGLVRGLYQTQTMRQFFRYLPEHTCSTVMAKQGAEVANMDFNQIPDVPMNDMKAVLEAAGQDTSQMQGFDWNAVGVESINDIIVNGDEASATVNVRTAQGLDSSVMRFKREGGNWTFCDDK